MRGATALGAGGASAWQLGAARRATAAGKVAGGAAAMGRAGIVTALSPLRRSLADSAWARRMKRQQSLHHGLATAAHALRSGDHGGGGASVSLSERS